MRLDGAKKAAGLAGAAIGLAELHEGRVEGSGMGGRRDEVTGALPKGGKSAAAIDRGGVVKQAGKDAGHVAIDDGFGKAKGEAGDRASGVGADARKGEDGFRLAGEDACVVADDGLGEFLEVACAAVVAEAFPGAEDGRLASAGEGFEVGESGEPALVVAAVEDGSDLGLLKHEFRDQDSVGILGLAPGVVFAVGSEPALQITGDGMEIGSGGRRH